MSRESEGKIVAETELERAAQEYARAVRAARSAGRVDAGSRQNMDEAVREAEEALHAAAMAAYDPQPPLAPGGEQPG